MEILTLNVTPCYHVGNFRSKLIDKNSNSCKPGIFARKKTKFLFLRNDHNSGSLRFSGTDKFLECPNRIEGSLLFGSPLGFKVGDFKVSSGKFDGYVINADEDVGSISESGESTAKVLIPGLPDESRDCSAVIDSCFWEWKPKLYVHYEKAGSDNVKCPPVLFLPGFGVGSFHYKNQLKDLSREHRVWALDFLGQGLSLPSENPTSLSREGDELEVNSFWGFGDETEPWASELVYSIDLWKEQVRYFVEEVIGEPIYVTGNSLGGYVALYFAASYPQLVKGITLLNATPFWGFLPNPARSPVLARIFPWSGTFPLPANVRKITEFLWQKISDPKSIAQVLRQVYADHSTNVDQVFSRILEITEHPAAAASFASIMCAPQGQLSFGECLMRCRMNNLPICLMYGKEDPWVKPIWGLQVKRQVPEAVYYEISPAGHCPHDEVPEVVNYLIRGWIKNIESSGSVSLPLLNDSETIKQQIISRELEFPREGSRKSVKVRFFGSTFSLWERIRSALKSRLSNSETVSL